MMAKTKLKNGFSVEEVPWSIYIKQKKNQVFKLLPLREENGEWRVQLESLILELGGLNKQVPYEDFICLTIIAKLSSLTDSEEVVFTTYRKTVFEVISLLEEW